MADNRNLKNRYAVSMGIRKEVYERLRDYSKETMIPMSRVVDKAIQEYLDREEEKRKK